MVTTMGTQRIHKQRARRTPYNSHYERHALEATRRQVQGRRAHRQVRRLGAGHAIELEVLAAAVKPEEEG